MEGAETGTPREILQYGYKYGFIDDSLVWLVMLKKQNFAMRLYDDDMREDDINDTVVMIRDSFIPAFVVLEKTLKKKLAELEDE